MALPLKRVRRERGFSIQALAEATGLETSTIWRIETGQQHARPSTAKLLADALGVAVGDVRELANGGDGDADAPPAPDA
jgi:transcriptional regulator with XRE-family HTH domain